MHCNSGTIFFANTLKGKRAHEKKPTRFSYVNFGGDAGNRTRVQKSPKQTSTIIVRLKIFGLMNQKRTKNS